MRAGRDGYSVGHHFVAARFAGVELAGVSAVGLQSECAGEAQGDRLRRSHARGEEGAAAAAGADGHRPGDCAFAGERAGLHIHAPGAGGGALFVVGHEHASLHRRRAGVNICTANRERARAALGHAARALDDATKSGAPVIAPRL